MQYHLQKIKLTLICVGFLGVRFEVLVGPSLQDSLELC